MFWCLWLWFAGGWCGLTYGFEADCGSFVLMWFGLIWFVLICGVGLVLMLFTYFGLVILLIVL